MVVIGEALCCKVLGGFESRGLACRHHVAHDFNLHHIYKFILRLYTYLFYP